MRRSLDPRAFLTARWESLVLLNYACPPALLEPLVPRGTELDTWEGTPIISLVGFLFLDTRVRGLAIPCHRDFEEVNLRFYVRREAEGESRRAVVFIRELVPRLAIATVAKRVYNEPYTAVPMHHDVVLDPRTGGSASYAWRYDGTAFSLSAAASGPAVSPDTASEAEFITEHYWGYTRQRDGGTAEYRVAHDPWQIWTATRSRFAGAAESLYGSAFANVLRDGPRSAYVAVGGSVTVYAGRSLPS
jgi:uncharacterized protein